MSWDCMELWIGSNIMILLLLLLFFVVVYYCFSYGTCILFFLCTYIVSCYICITFLNMLPSFFSIFLFFIFFSHLTKKMLENVVKHSEFVYTRE